MRDTRHTLGGNCERWNKLAIKVAKGGNGLAYKVLIADNRCIDLRLLILSFLPVHGNTDVAVEVVKAIKDEDDLSACSNDSVI